MLLSVISLIKFLVVTCRATNELQCKNYSFFLSLTLEYQKKAFMQTKVKKREEKKDDMVVANTLLTVPHGTIVKDNTIQYTFKQMNEILGTLVNLPSNMIAFLSLSQKEERNKERKCISSISS